MVAPDSIEQHDSLLAKIVDSCLDDIQNNQPPQLEEYVSRYPELATELQAILPALCALGGEESVRATLAAQAEEGEDAPVRLGDFVIQRELGRGGMGVVYEAYQSSLHRTVALKVLPFASVLDPRDIQRFRNEAQIAAQLHHPHIVPVYAVGCENGVHYYAMQLVEGQSVAQLIRELAQAAGTERDEAISTITVRLPESTAAAAALTDTNRSLGDTTPHTDKENFRAIAWLGIQAAEALEYAHSVGLVHRDVKPSNLLIDQEGTLWVSDFGLAKVATSGQLTLTGDLLGTIAYMSPEQARGGAGRVDHRSDIYSLGATLYELVALRRPFESNDRMELLQQVAHGEPRPLRQLNRAVPQDLETIIHKAMAREAADRYDTAEELAADLRRFLESRPIHARRPSLLDRSGKWVQRHRVMVLALAGFLLLTTVGSVAATALVLKQKAAADEALVAKQAALQHAEEQSRRAEEQSRLAEQALLDLSQEQEATEAALSREQAAVAEAEEKAQQLRDAVDELYLEVVTKWLWSVPQMTHTQEDFLEKIHAYYEEFSETSTADPELEYNAAITLMRMGLIQANLGNTEGALQRLEEAAERLELMIARDPSNREVCENLSELYLEKGSILSQMARQEEGRESLVRAKQILSDTLTLVGRDYGLERMRLKSDYYWASCLVSENNIEEAEAHIMRVLEREDMDRLELAEWEWVRAYHLASLLQTLAHIEMWRNNFDEALQRLEQTEPLLAVVEKRGAAAFPVRILLRDLADDQAEAHICLQEYRQAVEICFRCRDISLGLRADFPEGPDNHFFVASDDTKLATALLYLGEYEDADHYLTESLQILSQLTQSNSDSLVYRNALILVHARLAMLAAARSRSQEAVEYFERAIEQQKKVQEEQPHIFSYVEALANYLTQYAAFRVMAIDDEFRNPQLSWDLSHRVLQLMPDDAPAHTVLGMVCCRQGKFEEAIARLEGVLPYEISYQAEGRLFLALAYHETEQEDDAQRQYRLAEECMAQTPDLQNPLLDNLHQEVAQALGIAEEAGVEDAATDQTSGAD